MKYLVIIFLFFIGMAHAAPYPESQYRSLYQPQTISYTDQNGVVKTQVRAGFRYLNDLTDSIIVCQKENNPCNALNRRWTFNAGFQGDVTLSKVFVPPGATSVSFNIFVGQGPMLEYFAVARLGAPPQVDSRYQPSDTEFSKLPSLGFTLAELRSKDCIGRHSGGILTLVYDSGPGIVTEPDGAWLYIMSRVIEGDVISGIYTLDVNTGNPSAPGTYIGWYSGKTTAGTWGTLNEMSYINVPSGPYPTPIPEPAPTPPPAPIDYGCDMYTCPNGHCVVGVCVPFTQPDPTPMPRRIILMNILNTPITINMQPTDETTGLADVSVGEFLYPGITYTIH